MLSFLKDYFRANEESLDLLVYVNMSLFVSMLFFSTYILMCEFRSYTPTNKYAEDMDITDVNEIPPKYLHFQKLVDAVVKSELPKWCIHENLTQHDVILQIIDWMNNNNHYNKDDVKYALDAYYYYYDNYSEEDASDDTADDTSEDASEDAAVDAAVDASEDAPSEEEIAAFEADVKEAVSATHQASVWLQCAFQLWFINPKAIAPHFILTTDEI
jgi:hypothetical protein